MKKGFIKNSQNAVYIQQSIAQLNERGVATDSIIIEKKFNPVFSQLKKGDTIIVTSLQDVCAGMKELLHLLERLTDAGIALVSIDEFGIELDPADEKMAALIRNINRFRINITARNIRTGLNKAIDKGAKLGRPVGMTPDMKAKMKRAVKLYQTSDMSTADICRHIGLNKSSFYHYIKVMNIVRPKKAKKSRKQNHPAER